MELDNQAVVRQQLKQQVAKASESGATGDVSEATQKIIDKGVLKVGSSGDLYAYLDQNTGEFVGPDADIIKEAAKRLGIPKVEMSLILFSRTYS